MDAICKTVDTVGAEAFAPAAGCAVHGAVLQHRQGRESLRIVTPGAAQVAALQKHRGADSGAVVGAEFLNIENCGGRGV